MKFIKDKGFVNKVCVIKWINLVELRRVIVSTLTPIDLSRLSLVVTSSSLSALMVNLLSLLRLLILKSPSIAYIDTAFVIIMLIHAYELNGMNVLANLFKDSRKML